MVVIAVYRLGLVQNMARILLAGSAASRPISQASYAGAVGALIGIVPELSAIRTEKRQSVDVTPQLHSLTGKKANNKHTCANV